MDAAGPASFDTLSALLDEEPYTASITTTPIFLDALSARLGFDDGRISHLRNLISDGEWIRDLKASGEGATSPFVPLSKITGLDDCRIDLHGASWDATRALLQAAFARVPLGPLLPGTHFPRNRWADEGNGYWRESCGIAAGGIWMEAKTAPWELIDSLFAAPRPKAEWPVNAAAEEALEETWDTLHVDRGTAVKIAHQFNNPLFGSASPKLNRPKQCRHWVRNGASS